MSASSGGAAHSAATAGVRNSRQAASLGVLTRRFLDVLRHQPSQKVDLNEVAQTLGVPKRRIYDITNVLEGIGMLDKLPKGCILWRGNDANVDGQLRRDIARMRDEVIALAEEETRIDEYFRRVRAGMQSQMQQPEVRKSLYLTEQDLEEVLDPSVTTAFALRGTEGTRLFLRDPSDTMRDGSQHFEVELRSTAPLAVTLLAERDGGANAPAPAAAAAAAEDGDNGAGDARRRGGEEAGTTGASEGTRRHSSRIALQEMTPAAAAGAANGGGASAQ